MAEVRGFWVAGEQRAGDGELEVTSPLDGSVVARVGVPTDADVERAVAAAAAVGAPPPAHLRAAALTHVSQRLAERAAEVSALITAENGKPAKWADLEVARAVSTFRWAAEEARRDSGELQRLDTDPSAEGRLAVVRRFPRGPVLGIAPFNFPLNLVAHKVAPALAAGAPIVLKPAPATPLSALLLGELVAETELPAGMLSVLPLPNDRLDALVDDPRLPVVSFTGSGPVGWALKERLPRKQVILELGGNAAVVVAADYPDLDWAAQRIATFSNYQAGQSCIAVQRVYVERPAYQPLLDRLLVAVEALDTDADVGPLINEDAAPPGRVLGRGVGRHGADRRHPVRLRVRADGAGRRAGRGQGGGRGGVRAGAGDRRGRLAGRGVRGGERLPVRAAGRRVHPGRRRRVPGPAGAAGRRGDRRRRAELPGRPDAVRRDQGVRHRPGGGPGRDGRPDRAPGAGADRPGPLGRAELAGRG